MSHNAATMAGLAKKVYAGKEQDLLRNDQSTVVADSFPFAQGKRTGDHFAVPVMLTREFGITASGGGREAKTANAVIPSNTREAQFRAMSMYIRSSISFDQADAMLQGEGAAQEKAFLNGTRALLEALKNSSEWFREVECLYGGGDASTAEGTEGIGLVLARTNDSGTTQTFSVSEASFAEGIFAGLENARVDFYSDDLQTHRNPTTPARVSAVNLAARTFTVVGNESELDGVAPTDKIFLLGTMGEEMNGLVKVAKNTGTLNNIDASAFSLWRASQIASPGAASFAKILRGLVRPANRGATGKMIHFVPTATWVDIVTDLNSARRYADKVGGKLEAGAQGLEFYGPNGIVATFEPSPMVKNGYIIVANPAYTSRIGSSDDSSKVPGMGVDNFFTVLQDSTAYQIGRYWQQTIACERPATVAIHTGVQPTSY